MQEEDYKKHLEKLFSLRLLSCFSLSPRTSMNDFYDHNDGILKPDTETVQAGSSYSVSTRKAQKKKKKKTFIHSSINN